MILLAFEMGAKRSETKNFLNGALILQGSRETQRLMSYLDPPKKNPRRCQALHVYLLKNKLLIPQSFRNDPACYRQIII